MYFSNLKSMKNIVSVCPWLCMVVLSVFAYSPVSAQTYQTSEKDMAAFLQASSGDASKLIGAFVGPAIRGVSYGMTSGWYNTAKTHKKLGFDLGITVSAVMLPSSDNTFNTGSLNLSSNTIPNNQTAPTIVGGKDASSYIIKLNNTSPGILVQGPEGLDLKGSIGVSAIPVPMIQLGIGTIKNTDLKVRLMPQRTYGKSTFGMFGVGLMHDLKQYLPGVKVLPFDFSILAAYNSVSGTTSLVNNNAANVARGVPQSNDGEVSYKLNSWVIQALISKKLSVLTLYAGLGFGTVNSKVDITGTFNVGPTGLTVPITNPFNNQYTHASPKLTAGMRLKFGPLYFNGDYTLQTYNAVTVGIGLAIR